MNKYDLKYSLEHIMSYKALLGPREIIGPTPDGLRINIYVTGGEVTGPNIQGKILPVGGDWFTIRRDGMGLLNVRTTIETSDGALIYVSYHGLTDLGEAAYDRYLKGQTTPQERYVRTNPKVSTAHSNYLWLNRLFCLGIGKIAADVSEVMYDVYAVR